MRTIVLLMMSMVLIDSVDPPDRPRRAQKGDSTNVSFVDKAAFEHHEGDKEGRVWGAADGNLYRNAIAEIDLSSLAYITIKFNSSTATSLFESLSSDLPSPPPKV